MRGRYPSRAVATGTLTLPLVFTQVAKKPTSLNFLEAAGVPLAGLTAWQALTNATNLDVQAGETVLILGGSGGVGSFAVQWAKNKGCTVIATCSAANVKYVEELGADRVVNYREEGAVEALEADRDTIDKCFE